MRRRSGSRRRPKPSRTKRTELKRQQCVSGKLGFRHQAEAQAFLRDRPNETLTTYRCPECDEWHLGDKVPRSIRRRAIEEGKPIPPPREES